MGIGGHSSGFRVVLCHFVRRFVVTRWDVARVMQYLGAEGRGCQGNCGEEAKVLHLSTVTNGLIGYPRLRVT